MKEAYETVGKIPENNKVQKGTAPQSNQTRLNHLTTNESCHDVKQFKVGMEYQTFGGKWNIKKLKPGVGRDAAESSEANLLQNLDSADRYFSQKETDYRITSDGVDLEYITKAFDEFKEKAALVQSATAAGAYHRAFSNMTNNLHFGKYLHLESGGECYYINKEGEITGHPQATIGVRCESIEALFEKLANNPGEYLADAAPKEKTDIGKKKIIKAIASTTTPPEFSPTAKGFLLLVEENIHGAALAKTMHFENLLEQFNALKDTWNQQLDTLIIPPFADTELKPSIAIVKSRFQQLRNQIEKVLSQSDEWRKFSNRTLYNIKWVNKHSRKKDAHNLLAKIAVEEEQMRISFNNIITNDKVETLVLDPQKSNFKQSLQSHLDSLLSKTGTVPLFSLITQRVKSLEKKLNTVFVLSAFKYALPVKERTSLKDLFCLLSQEERARVKTHLGQYGQRVLIVRQENVTVKLSDFLASLPDTSDGTDVVDLIKKEVWSVGELDNAALGDNHPDNHGANYFKEYGITRSTDIGQDKADDPNTGTTAEAVHGVIVELRDMKRNVPPEEWGHVAAAVADAAQILNQ